MIGTRTKIYFFSIKDIFEDHDTDETKKNEKTKRNSGQEN